MPVADTEDRIAAFKRDLIAYEPIDMCRRHVVFGECAVLSPEEYFRLRAVVATRFELHPNDVLVVGSGKLGFSIAPKKRYNPFGDKSDLDVVIISQRFFDLVWTDVHRYSVQGGYWEKAEEFRKYLFRGWIRPDKLPPDQRFPFGKEWWAFFNELSATREFATPRIRGAIYKNWHFLESYQRVANTPVFLVAGDKLIAGGSNQIAFIDPKTGKQIGERQAWNLRGCTDLRGSASILTTRFMGNAAYMDLATGKITSIWNVRAACSNNLFPANGILNVPNLSDGCTCNYMPVSQALVPAQVVETLAGRTGEEPST